MGNQWEHRNQGEYAKNEHLHDGEPRGTQMKTTLNRWGTKGNTTGDNNEQIGNQGENEDDDGQTWWGTVGNTNEDNHGQT